MESNNAGARFGEIRHDAVNRLHHQMDVNRGGNAVIAQRFQHHRPDGQIGHIVVVHNVEMDHIRAGCQCIRSVFTQAGEIGRQN